MHPCSFSDADSSGCAQFNDIAQVSTQMLSRSLRSLSSVRTTWSASASHSVLYRTVLPVGPTLQHYNVTGQFPSNFSRVRRMLSNLTLTLCYHGTLDTVRSLCASTVSRHAHAYAPRVVESDSVHELGDQKSSNSIKSSKTGSVSQEKAPVTRFKDVQHLLHAPIYRAVTQK